MSQQICGLDSLIFIWIKDKLCSLQKLDIMYFRKENIKSVVQICVYGSMEIHINDILIDRCIY